MLPFIEDMRRRNGSDAALLHEIETELKERNISDIIKDLESTSKEEEEMVNHFTLQCTTLANQLRQRADLLRQKADEMDRKADSIAGPVLENTIKVINTASQGLRDIEELLRSHAHIEPTKIK
jgi:hypothetical protein